MKFASRDRDLAQRKYRAARKARREGNAGQPYQLLDRPTGWDAVWSAAR